MANKRFDDLARAVSGTRRLLVAGALTAAAGWLGAPAGDSKRKRKGKQKRKPPQGQPNTLGCINVGDYCATAGQCCSGICDGPRGKRTCRAHDSGSCQPGSIPIGCGGSEVACTTSDGNPGFCATTTGNAGYCFSSGAGYPCKTDAECQTAQGGIFGPRSACVLCPGNPEVGGTGCVTIDKQAM